MNCPEQEAENFLRQFPEGDPGIFNAHLTSSLNNFSARLSDLGHHEHALEVNREAVDLFRHLAASRPNVLRHHSMASLPV